MKFYILTTLIFLSRLNFYAQYYSVDFDNIPAEFSYSFGYDKLQDSLLKEYKVIKYNKFKSSKKGVKELYSTCLINQKTKEKVVLSNLSGKKIRSKTYQKINNFKVFQWKTYWKAQKQINEYETINGKQFLKEVTRFTKNKKQSTKIYFRNDTGRLDSTLFFSSRDKRPYSKGVYYYQNDKLFEAKYYIKGKLKTIDKFNCNPIGEPIKKVSQSSSCVNTEYDKDGNKIEVFIDVYKRKERKTKVTYKGNSKRVIKIENFDSKNQLYSLRSYSKDKSVYVFYKKPNKISFKQISYYNEKKQLMKFEFYNKTKLTNTTLHEYNKMGLKIKSTYTYKKDDLKITYYEYEFQK